MAIEKVKAYFKNYGMEDRVMEKDSSSATVEEAADVLGCEPGRIAIMIRNLSAVISLLFLLCNHTELIIAFSHIM